MKKILSLLFVIPLAAFTFISNNEKQVNTYTTSYQREPAIASSKTSGDYIIVWTSNLQDGSGEGVYAQRFDKNNNKIGSEFKVNSLTEYDQNKPAVAMNNNGDFVVTWASTQPNNELQDIYCQIYNSNGTPKGSQFLVNTTTFKSQNCPDIAMDQNGNFVIVWHSWDEDGGDRGVYAQRFKNDGTKIGTQFLVNTFTKFSQCEPSIAMTPDGKFVIAWQSWGQDDTTTTYYVDYGVYAQMFNSDGSKSGNEFRANTTKTDDQFYPDAAIDDNGNFLIVWTSWNSGSSNFSEVMGQRFDKSGNKIGTEFMVNTTLPEYQWLPSAYIWNDGSFAISWGSWKQDKSREGVYLQYFNSDGSKLNKEYQVNYYTESFQWEPQITSTSDGGILIAYSSWNQDGDDYGIFTRTINPGLTPVKDLNSIDKSFKLEQNYPNPFNPETTIAFHNNGKNFVEILIYDISGKIIKILKPTDIKDGMNYVKWDGKDGNSQRVSTGTYFYSIKTEGTLLSKKMLLIH